MLTAEQAREQLRAVAVPDASKRQAKRIDRFYGKTRLAGIGLLGWQPGLSSSLSSDQVGAILDDLPDRKRSRLFGALHPSLAELLEFGWFDLRRDPYTLGPNRRAFRAPDHPEASRTARVAWVRNLGMYAEYQQPPEWFAAWGSYLAFGGESLGRALGIAIDRGRRDVFDTLVAALRGEHEIARMGRHVPVALLSAANPDGWEQIERLLLAAQRQEGLRQVILEAIDLAHPDAFRRMLRLAIGEGLTRFAAMVRAAGVWFGEAFDVRDRQLIDGLLADLLELLEDPIRRDGALSGQDPGRLYLALWTCGFENAPNAISRAAPLLDSPIADIRLAATRFLADLQLQSAARALVPALTDPDLRVAAAAFQAVRFWWPMDGAFEALCSLLDRLTRSETLPLGIWKPTEITLSPSDVADTVMFHLGGRPPTALAGIVGRMSPAGRSQYASMLASKPEEYRTELLELAGDRSDTVRAASLRTLEKSRVPDVDEASSLESFLSRKSADLRRGVMSLLLRQDDHAAVASVERLLAGTASQREAGLEMMRELDMSDRATARLRELSARSIENPPADGGREGVPVPAGRQRADLVTRDSLIDHEARTPAVQPRDSGVNLERWKPGVTRVLRSLDAWIAEHRDVEVTFQTYTGPRVELVSNLRWLPSVAHLPWESQRRNFPVPEIIDPWWERTQAQLSDGGVEVLLAWSAVRAGFETNPAAIYGRQRADPPRWSRDLVALTAPLDVVRGLNYTPIVGEAIAWAAIRDLRPSWIDSLLDITEAILSLIPTSAIRSLPMLAEMARAGLQMGSGPDDWRSTNLMSWYKTAVTVEAVRPEAWTAEQRARLWRLARFVDEPRGIHRPDSDARDLIEHPRYYGFGTPTEGHVPRRCGRVHPPLRLTVRAVDQDVASRADLIDLLIGERTFWDASEFGRIEFDLGELTRRHRPDWMDDHQWLAPLVEELRDKIVAVEAQRGDLPTPLSRVALHLRGVEGADTVAHLLASLGKQKLVRGWIWRGESKPEVLSKLIRVSFPAPDDTVDTFGAAVERHQIKRARLLDLAVYAPQWASFVEAVTGWQGLTEAVHWLHAHTKDERWQVDQDVRSEWVAETHKRTPLSAQDLIAGAVDVAWFERIRSTLGDDRFDDLLKAAKFASGGGGHKRAELFARALRGQVARDELLSRIKGKRNQDSVRALGLLPLPADERHRKAEVLARYETLQAWRKESRNFGQQRRASEDLAARVAMENLARAAGYRDPQRLQWAMEAEAVADLASGPIAIKRGEVEVSLSIDEAGAPRLSVRRGERALKAIPKEIAKEESIGELKRRARQLRDQARRMRESLEESCVRGDRFSVQELAELLAHPVLAPMLARLVFATEESLLGFPRAGGTALADHDGTIRPVDGSSLRVVHPLDLLKSDEWHEWQHACFERRVRQPFKQVFRELYVLTPAERGGETLSARYAGHQVNPRQAVALLGSRGWVVERDAGAIKTYHDAKLTAVVDVVGGWTTPLEVEDISIESVSFVPVGDWKPLPLIDVPPRIFSEAIRDVDLVVSVAHAGGVDPEASASTIEMRAALVRETSGMLSMDNVELTATHVLINGTLGSYSIHLGSGTVHRRPGNAVCIVPVGAQHRGRLFLPFVDDDPRTAEVISKVVLLARDHEIRDPTILEQLR